MGNKISEVVPKDAVDIRFCQQEREQSADPELLAAGVATGWRAPVGVVGQGVRLVAARRTERNIQRRPQKRPMI